MGVVSHSFQIEDKVIPKTFLRWVRTSANFFEVPWLIIEPKVSIIPSAWNCIVSGTFLTAESFGIFLIHSKNETDLYFFAELLNLPFKRDNGCATSTRILGGIFKTFDMFVATEVLGHPFTDNSRPDPVDDIDLGHVVEQGLIDKAI